MKQALDLIFPQDKIKDAVICEMVRKYDVIFNLRRAKVTESVGEIVLELEGDEQILTDAIQWLKSQGLKVEPIGHDTVES